MPGCGRYYRIVILHRQEGKALRDEEGGRMTAQAVWVGAAAEGTLLSPQPSSSTLVNRCGSPQATCTVCGTQGWRAMGDEGREKGLEEHAWLRVTDTIRNS